MNTVKQWIKNHPKVTATIGAAAVAGATAAYGPGAGEALIRILPAVCAALGVC